MSILWSCQCLLMWYSIDLLLCVIWWLFFVLSLLLPSFVGIKQYAGVPDDWIQLNFVMRWIWFRQQCVCMFCGKWCLKHPLILFSSRDLWTGPSISVSLWTTYCCVHCLNGWETDLNAVTIWPDDKNIYISQPQSWFEWCWVLVVHSCKLWSD